MLVAVSGCLSGSKKSGTARFLIFVLEILSLYYLFSLEAGFFVFSALIKASEIETDWSVVNVDA